MSTTTCNADPVAKAKSDKDKADFKEKCDLMRKQLGKDAQIVKYLRVHEVFGGHEIYSGQYGEMHANITLAYRHLEDARMRIGKILQAAGDGVSILDK